MSPAREGGRRGISPSLQEGPGQGDQGILHRDNFCCRFGGLSLHSLPLLQDWHDPTSSSWSHRGQGSSQGSVEVLPQVPTGGDTEDTLISSLLGWEKGIIRASSPRAKPD